MAFPEFNLLLKEILSRLGDQNGTNDENNDKNRNKENKEGGKSKINLNPSQVLVIAGFLGGVLDVESVLVDKQQGIEILITGSLKQKTQLEKVMEQIGDMPFDQVMQAMLGRFK